MADKPFGVRQLNIVGAAGTPTIESAAALRIGGQQVAITTNTSVAGVVTAASFYGDGSNLSGVAVPANLTATTLDVSGICTAGSFVTDLISGDGTSRGFATRYYITADGSTSYRFAGPGMPNTVANPTIYLMRGFTYIFENSTGGSHPFRIQFTGTTTGVGTYVSGSNQGIQVFTIPHDAPANYQYQCTIHSGMIGSFVIPN
jgi:plastocyanin